MDSEKFINLLKCICVVEDISYEYYKDHYIFDKGYCDIDSGTIYIQDCVSHVEVCHIFLHELCHICGGSTRLNRKSATCDPSLFDMNLVEEIIVNTSCGILLSEFGVMTKEDKEIIERNLLIYRGSLDTPNDYANVILGDVDILCNYMRGKLR